MLPSCDTICVGNVRLLLEEVRLVLGGRCSEELQKLEAQVLDDVDDGVGERDVVVRADHVEGEDHVVDEHDDVVLQNEGAQDVVEHDGDELREEGDVLRHDEQGDLVQENADRLPDLHEGDGVVLELSLEVLLRHRDESRSRRRVELFDQRIVVLVDWCAPRDGRGSSQFLNEDLPCFLILQ